MSEKILVTGATGFIGSHLAEELLWKGFRVTALVRSNSNLQWLRGKNVDILPGDFVTGTLPSLDDFAYIFHVAGLTKALANAWASKGINVNALAPSFFKTELTDALQKDTERFKSITARTPAGRWGLPEDIAGAALFLASPASDFIHGLILPVDGGWMAW